VLETERGKNISACHYEKTGEPRPCELFRSGASKPARPHIIECIEDAELEASHRIGPFPSGDSSIAAFLIVRYTGEKG
jgi:hypothetical protein